MNRPTRCRGDLDAKMSFLARHEQWATVKPYSFQYYTKEDFPRDNVEPYSSLTRIRDLRNCASPPSFEREGFEILRFNTSMEYDDFSNEDSIEAIYCRELEIHFQSIFEAKHVRALDYQVRRRSMNFPYFNGNLPSSPQPSLNIHVDASPQAAQSIIRSLYRADAEEILRSRYQLITVWKPFRTPVEEWPLAVCDASSVDEADLVSADILYPNFVAENQMVHFNEKQRWYWLSNQGPDEVLAFKAVDSGSPGTWPCPHGAFPLPNQDSSTPRRESIDVRLLIFYADITYPEHTSMGV